MRKLATIRKIDELNPIEGADAIECATVGGWKVVAQKGLYKAGDLVVYFEIDSWIPNTLAPFLTKAGHYPKVYEGVEGERLKTIRLRGQISQGLLMPLEVAVQKFQDSDFDDGQEFSEVFYDGADVTDMLGILKWEKEIPAQLAGLAKGNFPTQVPKTDQERVQNLNRELEKRQAASAWFEVTEKLEGSSMTVYKINGEFGVCSRNLNLKQDENNAFWKVAIEDEIEKKIMGLPYDLAIQGELVGPGIQGNIYKLDKPAFYVFDCYHVNAGKYFEPAARRAFVDSLELKHVPVITTGMTLDSMNMDDILNMAEDKSVLNPKQEREGIVFKQTDGSFSFKAISNRYLLKSGD